MLTSAFPDLHTTVEDMIAEGDKVVARTTLNGTHEGPLWGIPPTGKPSRPRDERRGERQKHGQPIVLSGKQNAFWTSSE